MRQKRRTKKKGIFIVIDGSDGSGKATQLAELVKHLRKEGIEPKTLDFPRYAEASSYFVKEYLNGKYGTLEEVGPYRTSIFYALDRFAAAAELRQWLEEGRVVIANRYVTSNMGHQGAKFTNVRERKKFFIWLHELEYTLFAIPKPTITIVLTVPAAAAQRLVDKKGSREYIGGVKRDLHESDLNHLKRAEATYRDMVVLFPKEFRLIECTERGTLLPVETIHEKLWNIIKRYV